MTTSKVSKIGRWIRIALFVGGGLLVFSGSLGCDETTAIASGGGLANPYSTSSQGLPEYPPSYWESLGYGTQNVGTWGGMANPYYTSSLGLPAMW